MPDLLVFKAPRIRGYKKDGAAGRRMPAGEAFLSCFDTDAHCVQYTSRDTDQRLTREAVGEIEIAMRWHVFDIDGPDHAASDAWRAGEYRKIGRLNEAHPGAFCYDTRGGYRIVYALPDPWLIDSADAARQWSQSYVTAAAYLFRVFGINVDHLHDWQRLFRMPRATRDPAEGPELMRTFGDPGAIGPLRFRASMADRAAAQKRTPKVFRAPRARPVAGPVVGDGQGMIYHALLARGDVKRAHEPGQSYVVRCPNEAQHTSGRTYDGSTLLYLPEGGDEVGVIHCKHGHCLGLEVRDYVAMFRPAELEAARERAGIARQENLTSAEVFAAIESW